MQNTVRTWNFYIIDFGEIVIRGCQPEYGNAIDPGGGRLISSLIAVKALKIANSGPPNNPTCWPVITAAVPAPSRAMFSSALAEAPQFLFCASRTEDTCARIAES